MFGEPPGSYDICPVCFWEDDPVQLRWPGLDGGANRPSLVDAQANYARTGAVEARLLVHVRAATADEPLEPAWRPIDPATDDVEAWGDDAANWPADRTTLYWWRATFWHRQPD